MGQPVAIVILNYNGWRYTVECLESLGHLDYRDWWVVVVDNGSTDDSVERLRAWARGEVQVESRYVREPGWAKPVRMLEYQGEPPENAGAEDDARLVLIRLPENRGFAGGNNVGIRYALRRGADWTWLLNNDTVVAPNSLSEMLKAGEADERIGVVGCKLLYYDRPDTIQAAGGGRFYFCLGIARHYGWMQKDDGRWDRPFEPHYVTGASMLVRGVYWREVGLLDEGFFFYGEEVDWQLRAKKRGWRTAYAHRARVYHREGGTAGRKSPWTEFHVTKACIRLCRRHAAWSVLPAVVVNVCRGLRRLFTGRWKHAAAVVRAVLAGVMEGP